MTDYKLVLTTAGSQDEARTIAHALVEGRLAACVNIMPAVESIYRWRENVDESQEWMLLIKTTAGAFERVRDAIRKLSSYELPECVCVSVEDGSAGYLEWIEKSVH